MEFLLALVAVAASLVLARRGFLHPGDYLVGAATAVTLAVAVLIATPNEELVRRLVQLGAPETSLARSEFLLAHGVKIVLGLMLFAAGDCVAAVLRRRATPERFA